MDCIDLRSSILNWFSGEMECRQDEQGLFTTVLPILKPNGDAIELGIQPLTGGEWRISDLGETHESMYLSGINLLEESERTDEFRQIVADHGITDSGSELSQIVSGDVAEHIFDFVNAVQSVVALQFTIKTRQPSRDFASVVAKFLAEQKASFEIPSQHVEGRTGRWKFQFSLNHVAEETLVRTVTATNTTQAMKSSEQAVFEIRDVREVRPDVNVVAIIDDEGERESLWLPRILRIYSGYNILVMPFMAQREQLSALAKKYAN